MATSYAHGAIQLTTGAIGTTFTVSGLSFQPEAIRFWWTGINSATDAESGAVNMRRGEGYALSTSVRRAIGSFSQDTAATSNCGGVAANDCCVVTTDGAGGIDGKVDINAVNSDGFQLIVDDVLPAAMTLFWEAFADGGNLQVTIGDITEPASAGAQSYSATGFTAGNSINQVVMLAGCQSTAAVGTGFAGDSGFCSGAATGPSNQCVVSGNADDASGTMDTDGYGSSNNCIAMCVVAGGTTNSRAALTAFGTNQFELTWAGTPVSGRKYIYMAIKGGAWRAGGFTIDGGTASATTAVTGLPTTTLRGVSFKGRMATDSGTAFATIDRISLGCASSTSSRRAMGQMDENATASSAVEIGTAVEYDQTLVFTGTSDTVIGTRDVSVFGTDNFTAIVDTAGGSASEWIGYLAFGDEPTVTGTLAVTGANDTSSATGSVIFPNDPETRPYLEWIEPEYVAEGGYGTLGFRIDFTPSITGAVAAAESDDTQAASGKVTVKGTVNQSEADDTQSASGKVTASGTLAQTESDDTLTGSGKIQGSGTLSQTEADDSLAAVGKIRIVGSLNVTESDDTIVATGGTGLNGALAVTESNDALAASGTLKTSGTLARTEQFDTLVASGAVQQVDAPETRLWLEGIEHDLPIEGGFGTLGFRIDPGPNVITGTLAKTEQPDIPSFSGFVGSIPTDDSETRPFLEPYEEQLEQDRQRGVLGFEVDSPIVIVGTLARTNANDSQSASGKVTVKGTVARTTTNDTLAASGGTGLVGSVNVTEADDALASSGKVTVKGTLAQAEADDTLTGSGTTKTLGSLARSESSDTLAASGKVNIAGTLARTEDADSVAANGSVGNVTTGTLAATETNDTLAATGKLAIRGTMAQTESDDTLTASGTTDIDGFANITEGDDSSAIAGKVTSKGTLAQASANDTSAITAKVRITGSVSTGDSNDTVVSSGTCKTLGIVAISDNDDIATISGKGIIRGTSVMVEARDVSVSYTFPPTPPASPKNTKRGRRTRRIVYGDPIRIIYGRKIRTTRRP